MSLHDLIMLDPLWPFKLSAAIVLAYLVHEWITDKIDGGPPDCPA